MIESLRGVDQEHSGITDATRPPPVDLKFGVDVHVVRLDRATDERAEDVQLGYRAERPLGQALIKCPKYVLDQIHRPFPLHHTSAAPPPVDRATQVEASRIFRPRATNHRAKLSASKPLRFPREERRGLVPWGMTGI